MKTWANYFITKGLKAFEQVLSETKGKYCVGDDLTLADVFLAPQFFAADRFGVDISQFPNV